MSDRKILVLDIDGTLVNSEKKITPKTKEALINAQEKGHILALASGRPYPGMKQYINELRMDEFGGYALSFNGGMIVDTKSGKAIYNKAIDERYARPIYEYALKNDIGLVTYEGENVITGSRLDDYMEYEARLNYMTIKKVDDFAEYVDFPMIKCLLTAEPEKAERCEKELFDMLSPELNVFRSEPYFIEITTAGVDKAESIDKLIKMLGIAYEDTICCGDGFNDLTMVKYAKVGVAMANAQQVVKDSADFITGSCDEDGLCTVVERFL